MWSGSDEEDEEFLYKCKLCPGQTFTAAQRDEHREKHRQEGRTGRSNKRRARYVVFIKSNTMQVKHKLLNMKIYL